MKEKTKMIPGCVNPLAVGEHNMNDNIIMNHEQHFERLAFGKIVRGTVRKAEICLGKTNILIFMQHLAQSSINLSQFGLNYLFSGV